LQVALLDGKSETLALLDAALLIRSRGAESGVKGDVVSLVARGTRFDIPSVLAVSLGERSSSRVLAG
jgi:hypothetical protein